jgi:hypothetical protein
LYAATATAVDPSRCVVDGSSSSVGVLGRGWVVIAVVIRRPVQLVVVVDVVDVVVLDLVVVVLVLDLVEVVLVVVVVVVVSHISWIEPK